MSTSDERFKMGDLSIYDRKKITNIISDVMDYSVRQDLLAQFDMDETSIKNQIGEAAVGHRVLIFFVDKISLNEITVFQLLVALVQCSISLAASRIIKQLNLESKISMNDVEKYKNRKYEPPKLTT